MEKDQNTKAKGRSKTKHLPYTPPKILEEKIFEREALIAACNQAGVCHPFAKLPS